MIDIAPTPRVNTGLSSAVVVPHASPSSSTSSSLSIGTGGSSSSVTSLINSAASIRFIPSQPSSTITGGMTYRSGGSLSAPSGPPSVMPAHISSTATAGVSSSSLQMTASTASNGSRATYFSPLSDQSPATTTTVVIPTPSTHRSSSRAIASYVAPGVASMTTSPPPPAGGGSSTLLTNTSTNNTTTSPSPPTTRVSSLHHHSSNSRSGTSTPAPQVEGISPRGIGNKVIVTVDPSPVITPLTNLNDQHDGSEKDLQRPSLSVHTSSAEQQRSPSNESRRLLSPNNNGDITTPPATPATTFVSDLPCDASANGLPHV
jgi:hypothetical protein